MVQVRDEDTEMAYRVQTAYPMENLNDVYWQGDESVAGLMERLGISRSTLYAAVEPLPVGSPCPRCGGELVFTNRSARAAGRATCAECGEVVAELPEAAEEESQDGPDGFGDELAERAGGMYQRFDETERELTAARVRRASILAGALALGAAAGIAAVVVGRHFD